MKKAIMFIFSILLSSAIFAYPKVGDSVTYNGKFYNNEHKITVGFIQEIVVLEFDGSKGKIQNTFYSPDGSDSVDVKDIVAQDLKTQSEVLEILSNCEKLGGSLQKINVIAGTFETCYFIDDKKNEVWIGDVPFTIVKQVDFDDKGNRIEVELSLFTVQH